MAHPATPITAESIERLRTDLLDAEALIAEMLDTAQAYARELDATTAQAATLRGIAWTLHHARGYVRRAKILSRHTLNS